MKASSEDNYINLEQTMAGYYNKQRIKTNLSALPEIIATLQLYQKELSDPSSIPLKL